MPAEQLHTWADTWPNSAWCELPSQSSNEMHTNLKDRLCLPMSATASSALLRLGSGT